MFLNWKVNKDWTEEAEFSYQGWVRNKGVVKDLWIGRQPGADIRMDGGKGVLGMQISFIQCNSPNFSKIDSYNSPFARHLLFNVIHCKMHFLTNLPGLS